MLTPFYPHPLLNLSYNKYKGCKVFLCVWAVKRATSLFKYVVLQQTPREWGYSFIYISEHKSVCYSFVTRMSVHKYSNNFSSPCFSLPSKLFRTNSPFLLSPDFLDHAPRAETLNSLQDVYYYSVKPLTRVKKHYLIGYSWFQCCVYTLIFRHDSTVMIRPSWFDREVTKQYSILQESKHTIWKLL